VSTGLVATKSTGRAEEVQNQYGWHEAIRRFGLVRGLKDFRDTSAPNKVMNAIKNAEEYHCTDITNTYRLIPVASLTMNFDEYMES
jgi:hypothetical protein